MMRSTIAIYGSGGFAREVAWLIQELNNSWNVACFIDDDESKQGNELNDIPILSLEEAKISYPDAHVIGGIGSPKTRESVVKKTVLQGFDFISVSHPNVEMSNYVELGKGVVVCAGSILTTNIKIGNHVHINPDCTIGHDVVMSDFVTLAPGVHVSGNVHLGKRAYIGTGANIIHGTEDEPLIIGDDAIVGAGACVIKSVPSGHTVVGVPAKSIEKG